MRRRMMACLLCLALVGGMLAGCGGKGTGAQETIKETAQEATGAVSEPSGGAGQETGDDASQNSTGETAQDVADLDAKGAADDDGLEKADHGQGGGAAGNQDNAGPALLHPMVFQRTVSGYDEQGYLIMQEKYGSVQLKPDEETKWPALAKTLKEEAEADEAAAEEEFERDYADAKDFYTSGPGFGGNFSCETSYRVIRADEGVLSVRCEYSDYLGGAHGYYGVYGRNYDTASGKALKIDDVVKDAKELPEILWQKLATMPDADERLEMGVENLKGVLEEYEPEELYSWIMGYDGIQFIFNPYSIASYASGRFEVRILFEEYPELFEEKYMRVPERYVEQLAPNTVAYVDVNGDGNREEIQYFFDYNYDWYGYEAINICVGENKGVFGMYGYEVDCYLLHAGEKNYLYTFVTSENDFVGLEAYELMAGGVRKMDYEMGAQLAYLYGARDYRDEEERIYVYENKTVQFTDPDKFVMVSQMYPLGIIFGYKEYYLGQDGYAKGITPYYEISGDWKKEWMDGAKVRKETVTAIQDLEMSELNADFSDSGKKVIVPAGEVLEVLRTDNESYVDFRMEDGSLVRGTLMAEEYPYQICGIPMEEALDGIIYAG